MKWTDLRDRIDKAIAEKGIDPSKVEFWYIDSQAVSLYNHSIEIHIEDKHHPGEFELWID